MRLDLTQNRQFTLSHGHRAAAGQGRRSRSPCGSTSRARCATPTRSSAPTPIGCTTCCAPTPRPRNGKIAVEYIDPEPFSPEEDRAVGFGLEPMSLEGGASSGYLGIAGTNSTDDVDVLPVLSPEREPFLEYDLTRMVNNLANPDKPVVALVTGLPLNADPAMQYQPWQVMQELEQFFDVRLHGRRHRPVRRRCRRAAARPSAGAEREDALRHRPVRDARRQGAGVRRPALRGAGDAPAAAGHAGATPSPTWRSCSRPGASTSTRTASSATRSRRGRSRSRAAAASRWSTICPGCRSTAAIWPQTRWSPPSSTGSISATAGALTPHAGGHHHLHAADPLQRRGDGDPGRQGPALSRPVGAHPRLQARRQGAGHGGTGLRPAQVGLRRQGARGRRRRSRRI